MLFYTGADEISDDRAPKWAARWWDVFILNVLFLILCVYIKIPYEERYILRYNMRIYVRIKGFKQERGWIVQWKSFKNSRQEWRLIQNHKRSNKISQETKLF